MELKSPSTLQLKNSLRWREMQGYDWFVIGSTIIRIPETTNSFPATEKPIRAFKTCPWSAIATNNGKHQDIPEKMAG
jgi:hypothetical protein